MKFYWVFRILIICLLLMGGNVLAQITGYALQFDGFDDYVESTYATALGNTYTIELWANVEGDHGTLFHRGWSPYCYYEPDLYMMNENSQLTLNVQVSGCKKRQRFGIMPVANDVWFHVAVVVNGSTQTFFVNGNVVAVGNKSPYSFVNGYHWVGAVISSSVPPNGHFEGIIDEVRIWDSVRTPAEIAATMNDTLGRAYYENPASGLVCYWRFDGNALDLTGNQNHGIIHGAQFVLINNKPVADAGPDQTVEATSPTGANVMLNGSASSDPDGHPLTFKWYINDVLAASGVSPTIQFSLGTTTVKLIVNDGYEDSDPDYVDITVEDTTPPEILASLDTVEYKKHKVKYLVSYSATDIVDPAPVVSGVIKLPALNNPDLKLKDKDKYRLKIDTKKNKVEVEAPDAAAFWAGLLSSGGISVSDNQQIDMDFKHNDFKFDFKFDDTGELENVKAPWIALLVTAQDFSGNSATIEINPLPIQNNLPKFGEEIAGSVNPLAPRSISLLQNYPNPFNPSTTISFELPSESRIKLEIFNATGQIVETLINRTLGAGQQQILWNASQQPSGVYYYRLSTGNQQFTRRMLLLK